MTPPPADEKLVEEARRYVASIDDDPAHSSSSSLVAKLLRALLASHRENARHVAAYSELAQSVAGIERERDALAERLATNDAAWSVQFHDQMTACENAERALTEAVRARDEMRERCARVAQEHTTHTIGGVILGPAIAQAIPHDGDEMAPMVPRHSATERLVNEMCHHTAQCIADEIRSLPALAAQQETATCKKDLQVQETDGDKT